VHFDELAGHDISADRAKDSAKSLKFISHNLQAPQIILFYH